jgi:hypothetical protein
MCFTFKYFLACCIFSVSTLEICYSDQGLNLNLIFEMGYFSYFVATERNLRLLIITFVYHGKFISLYQNSALF